MGNLREIWKSGEFPGPRWLSSVARQLNNFMAQGACKHTKTGDYHSWYVPEPPTTSYRDSIAKTVDEETKIEAVDVLAQDSIILADSDADPVLVNDDLSTKKILCLRGDLKGTGTDAHLPNRMVYGADTSGVRGWQEISSLVNGSSFTFVSSVAYDPATKKFTYKTKTGSLNVSTDNKQIQITTSAESDAIDVFTASACSTSQS